jgi:hypothetical protein
MHIARLPRLPGIIVVIASLLGAGMVLIAAARPASAARDLPWCVEMIGGSYLDCSYYTHQQCIETARGVGPCIRNARFDWYYYLRGEQAPYNVPPGWRGPKHYRR